MLFLRFSSLPGGKIPEPRIVGTGAGRCVMGSPPSFPKDFLCFSLGFPHFPVERSLSRGLPAQKTYRHCGDAHPAASCLRQDHCSQERLPCLWHISFFQYQTGTAVINFMSCGDAKKDRVDAHHAASSFE